MCKEWLLQNVQEAHSPIFCGNDTMNGHSRFKKSRPVALFADSDVGLLVYKFSLICLGIPVSGIISRSSNAPSKQAGNSTSSNEAELKVDYIAFICL